LKRKHKRLTFVFIAMGFLGLAAFLVLSAFEDSIVFFYSPSDIISGKAPQGRRLRLGGLVEEGSVDKSNPPQIGFRVTDLDQTIPVVYTGLLPDLFREGQGVVTEGIMENGVFQAQEVLAKHDENYMPPEVADALKKSGRWKEKTAK
jgi:cytochrome c-type biogenesis protein CcmE